MFKANAVGGFLRLAPEIVEWSNLQPDAQILELGCGDGHTSVHYAAKLGPEGRVIGVDCNPDRKSRFQANAWEHGVKDRCSFQQGWIEAPPFSPRSFDCVVLTAALHRGLTTPKDIDNPPVLREVMEGLIRLLKPNGRLVLLDYLEKTNSPAGDRFSKVLKLTGYSLCDPDEVAGHINAFEGNIVRRSLPNPIELGGPQTLHRILHSQDEIDISDEYLEYHPGPIEIHTWVIVAEFPQAIEGIE